VYDGAAGVTRGPGGLGRPRRWWGCCCCLHRRSDAQQVSGKEYNIIINIIISWYYLLLILYEVLAWTHLQSKTERLYHYVYRYCSIRIYRIFFFSSRQFVFIWYIWNERSNYLVVKSVWIEYLRVAMIL